MLTRHADPHSQVMRPCRGQRRLPDDGFTCLLVALRLATSHQVSSSMIGGYFTPDRCRPTYAAFLSILSTDSAPASASRLNQYLESHDVELTVTVDVLYEAFRIRDKSLRAKRVKGGGRRSGARKLAHACWHGRTSTQVLPEARGRREMAIELQDEALAITQELGMRPLTERHPGAPGDTAGVTDTIGP